MPDHVNPAPPGQVLIGVSRMIRQSEVEHLSPDDQNRTIREVLELTGKDLRDYVGGVPPVGELTATVTGPHDDTNEGPIHLHTVAGYFRIRDLPFDSGAFRTFVTGEEPSPPPASHDRSSP